MSDVHSPFENSVLLEQQAREAVSNAIRGSLERNVPIVYSQDGKIYREYPDGRKEECQQSDQSLAACLPALGLLDLTTSCPLQPTTPGKKIVRIFAGPNGSGKSTIYEYIARRYESGTFVNPDYIQSELKNNGKVCLAQFGLTATEEDVRNVLRESSWGWEDLGNAVIQSMTVQSGPSITAGSESFGYSAAIIADVIRYLMLREGRHFSLETVMSHPSKIEFMWEARRLGYSCYLYFVCTKSPLINIERVRTRVRQGGHDVPTANIAARYYRTLRLLRTAIHLSFRSFMFDNSEKIEDPSKDAGRLLCLEFKEGMVLHALSRYLPAWVVEHALPNGINGCGETKDQEVALPG